MPFLDSHIASCEVQVLVQHKSTITKKKEQVTFFNSCRPVPVDGESYTTIIPKHRPQAMPLAHPEEVQGIPPVDVQKVKNIQIGVYSYMKLAADANRV